MLGWGCRRGWAECHSRGYVLSSRIVLNLNRSRRATQANAQTLIQSDDSRAQTDIATGHHAVIAIADSVRLARGQ